MNRPPAHTSVSLLASATIAPRSAAASVGLSPAAPVMAPITHSAGRSAASTNALSPAPTAIPVPPSAALSSPYAGRRPLAAERAQSSRRMVAQTAEVQPRAELARQRCQGRCALIGAHRLDAIAARLALDEIDGAGADRAGGAKQRQRALAVRRRLRCGTHYVGFHRPTTPAIRGPAPRNRRAATRSARPRRLP